MTAARTVATVAAIPAVAVAWTILAGAVSYLRERRRASAHLRSCCVVCEVAP